MDRHKQGMTAFDDMKKMSSLMAQAGIDMNMMLKMQVEETRHLPLYEVRDREGDPFSNFICNGCGAAAESSSEFLQCGKCKATKYCNRECQIRDWKGKGMGPTRPRSHKAMCSELAEAKQEFADNHE